MNQMKNINWQNQLLNKKEKGDYNEYPNYKNFLFLSCLSLLTVLVFLVAIPLAVGDDGDDDGCKDVTDAVISGRVFNEDTGNGITGVTIETCPSEGPLLHPSPITTDSNGNFAFTIEGSTCLQPNPYYCLRVISGIPSSLNGPFLRPDYKSGQTSYEMQVGGAYCKGFFDGVHSTRQDGACTLEHVDYDLPDDSKMYFRYKTVSECTDTAPTAPTLTAPANGATNQPTSITLDWENPSSWGTRCAGNQNNFIVFLEADDSTPDAIITSDTRGFSQFTVSGLITGKTYFWKVRAENGALSTDSEIRSFTVGSAATAETTQQTLYCRSDSKFVTDLDTPDSRTTCEAAGFVWTGTKCCSEDDDNLTTSTLREFYNDIGGVGGCWNSTFVESINFVKGTSESVLSFNGEFHGCAIDKQNYNTQNDAFLGIADKHLGDQLIRNNDYCFNVLDNAYYCSYTEKWLLTDGADKTHLSLAPIEQPKQAAECCAQKECWNGGACIENQRETPLELPIGLEQFGDGFRCIDGNWQSSTLKFTPDRSLSGYCPVETQCLLNPFGETESAQCINSTQYVGDDYCDNGNWTTRTKLLALELSGFISGDYSIFCDSKENTLNTVQYLTSASEAAADSLAKFEPNNFCILSSGGKVISAASLNKNIEEAPTSSLQVFGVTSCSSGLTSDGQYHPCDSTNKVWYNKRLKSIIYSDRAIAVASDQASKDSFEEFLEASIDNTVSSIKRLVASPPFDESYLSISKKVDRFYVNKQSGRTVIGTIEGTQFKNEIISYTNFDSNICDSTNQFNQAKKDPFSGVVCVNELKNYYVLAQGSQFTNLNPEAIWVDLTSKLRFK